MAKNYNSLISHEATTVQPISVSIVSSDSSAFSDLMYIGGSSMVALFIPGSNSGAAWVTANIAVYSALPNGPQILAANYAPLYKSAGTQYIITLPASIPATGIMIQVDPYDFVGLDGIQFQSVNQSSASTPVVQTNSPSVTAITIANGSF